MIARAVILCLLVVLSVTRAGSQTTEPITACYSTTPGKVFAGQPYRLNLHIKIPADTELENLHLQSSISLHDTPLKPTDDTQDGTTRTLNYSATLVTEQPMTLQHAGTLTAQLTQKRQTLGLLRSWTSRAIRIPVQPFELKIEPLPTAGRPADFSGSIGRYRLEGTLTPPKLRVGQLATLTLTLTGDGTPPAITNLQPKVDTTLYRMYPPKIVTAADGRQQTTQTIIPLTPQSTNLPPIRFSYYDTTAERYAELTAGPFPIEIDTTPEDTTESIKVIHVAAPAEPLPFISPQPSTGDRTLATVTALRLTPSLNSQVLYTLAAGTPVQVLEATPTACRVDHRGRRGWIPAEALTPSQQN